MNKLLPLVCAILFGSNLFAQSWLPENSTRPVKFVDIVNAYKAANPDVNKPGKKTGEDEQDFQFGRWTWYWQNHLDENGYLVPSSKTYQEWQAYKTGREAKEKLARTTGTLIRKTPWSFIGPVSPYNSFDGLGRVNKVVFHPTDANTYWVATPGGGAWKTTNNGAAWTSITDNLPPIGVSDIVVNPMNTNTLYLCTGDGDGRNFYSIGVLKSTNGGTTWDTTGLKFSTSSYQTTNCMLINPKDTSELLLAASDGLHRSMDGGKTWTTQMSGNFKQVLYHATDTNIVFATSYGTGGAGQIYRSKDGGKTWTAVTSLASALRICVAVTPANPAVVKAIAASSSAATMRGLNGIYTSVDTGKTFKLIYTDSSCTRNLLSDDDFGRTCHGQGDYDLCMAISPVDTSIVCIGGTVAWYSTNGGYYFKLLNEDAGLVPGVATIHPDKHFMAFSPYKSKRLFECNDGGIYYNDSIGGATWINITAGLGITQFYANAVDNNTNYILGGAQDNNTMLMYELGSYAPKIGGDGQECQIDYTDSTIFYVSVQYGDIVRLGGLGYEAISNNIPGFPSGAWGTPYVLHPKFHNYVIAGYQTVYLSRDYGHTWQNIGPGPLSNNISRLATTIADTGTIYAVEQGTSTIHVTHNLGTSWATITPPYSGAIISDIKIDKKDKNHFWVSFGGYTLPKVAEYKPATSTWVEIDTGLPNVPINCLERDTAKGDMYLGTEIGVFLHTDSMGHWEDYNYGMPGTGVNDFGINYNKGMLYAATFGRGMWKTPLHTYNPDTVVNTSIPSIPMAMTLLGLYPNPNSGQFTLTGNSSLAGQDILIRFINSIGAVVWQQPGTFDAAAHLQINTQGLPKGTYVLEAAKQNMILGRTKVVIY